MRRSAIGIAVLLDFWQQTSSLYDVAIVDRKQQLFENIARLRRVGRLVPDNEDLFAVRLGLEQELGETISRRLAAKLLGVSHTALERWIESGDVPLVFTAAGRQEVSVAALLDLYEAVRSSKTDGNVRRPLATALRSRQQAAERLRVDWPHDRMGSSYDRTHLRGLAYHQAVAGRLRKQTVADAKYVLYRWREQGRIDPTYAERWDRVLAMPLTSIRDAITAVGADADDLRQNSPFAGALTEPERRRILAERSVDAAKVRTALAGGNVVSFMSLSTPSLDLVRLRARRKEILTCAAEHGARNVRVFGSVARGEPEAASDVDLLVQMEPGRNLLDLVGLWQDLEDLLGTHVDVLSEGGVSPHLRERIYADAVVL